MRALVLILGLLPGAALAAPDDQLLRLVAQGLRDYRVEADVEKLTTAQAAAIYLAVSSQSDEDGIPGHTRYQILSILRWEDATNPDRK